MKTTSLVQKIGGLLPASFLRSLGRLYDRSPLFQSIIDKPLAYITGEGVIQRGPGRGLQFDASGRKVGYLLGTSDYEEQKHLESTLENGLVVYDVGANIGFLTLIAARCVGPDGFVYAFEPVPQTVKQLRKNILRNSFNNVEVIEAAANDRDGLVEIIAHANSDRSSIAPDQQADDTVEVKSLKLDTWRNGKKPPDMVKIDVEGAEIDVLYGAMETIEQFRPIILIEVHRIGVAFDRFMTKHLKPLGYTASTLNGEALPTEDGIRFHAHLQPVSNRGEEGKI